MIKFLKRYENLGCDNTVNLELFCCIYSQNKIPVYTRLLEIRVLYKVLLIITERAESPFQSFVIKNYADGFDRCQQGVFNKTHLKPDMPDFTVNCDGCGSVIFTKQQLYSITQLFLNDYSNEKLYAYLLNIGMIELQRYKKTEQKVYTREDVDSRFSSMIFGCCNYYYGQPVLLYGNESDKLKKGEKVICEVCKKSIIPEEYLIDFKILLKLGGRNAVMQFLHSLNFSKHIEPDFNY